MPRAKQLTVQLANKPGTLAQVAQALGRARVNMRALAVFEGRAKIIAEDPAKGREALQKDLDDEYVKQEALSKERDAAVRTARGGSIWTRTKQAAKWVGIGIVIGIVAKTAAH